jgi:hypothetical protein
MCIVKLPKSYRRQIPKRILSVIFFSAWQYLERCGGNDADDMVTQIFDGIHIITSGEGEENNSFWCVPCVTLYIRIVSAVLFVILYPSIQIHIHTLSPLFPAEKINEN